MVRIRSPRTILRILIFLVALSALGMLGLIGGIHLRAQWEARDHAVSALLESVERQDEEGLTLERVQNVALGLYLQLQQDAIDRPIGSSNELRTFIVEFGDTAQAVAERLQQEGLIADASLFQLYMRYHGIDRHLEAGAFDLAPAMNMREVAERLQRARIEETIVTIPEGWRAEQIADLLTEENITDGQRFLELVKMGDPAIAGLGPYPFLADRPPNASLEGYLFPDTYRLPAVATPEEVLRRLLDNAAVRLELDVEVGSLYEVINLASIVEREAVRADERPLIASVYLNRLNGVCTSEVGGRYLQADPTVQYAKGEPGNWWWQPASISEYKEINSLYNTYIYDGLPPGPISNPGLSAIQAVINPTATSYCFFVATGDGSHVFAETLAEHEANVSRYQQ